MSLLAWILTEAKRQRFSIVTGNLSASTTPVSAFFLVCIQFTLLRSCNHGINVARSSWRRTVDMFDPIVDQTEDFVSN